MKLPLFEGDTNLATVPRAFDGIWYIAIDTKHDTWDYAESSEVVITNLELFIKRYDDPPTSLCCCHRKTWFVTFDSVLVIETDKQALTSELQGILP